MSALGQFCWQRGKERKGITHIESHRPLRRLGQQVMSDMCWAQNADGWCACAQKLQEHLPVIRKLLKSGMGMLRPQLPAGRRQQR